MASVESLMKRTINSRQLSPDGIYTSPRSHSVYRLVSTRDVGKKYRYGNHPIRLRELVREVHEHDPFGRCEIVGIFLRKEEARSLAQLLNSS